MATAFGNSRHKTSECILDYALLTLHINNLLKHGINGGDTL